MRRKPNRRFLIAFVTMSLLTPRTLLAYNWPWDQDHDCVQVEDGTWGYWDYRGKWTPDPCCHCRISPVFAKTGNFQTIVTDATVKGLGPPLKISRAYNSGDVSDGLFGHGWTFNFGKQLVPVAGDSAEYLMVRLPAGERHRFYRLPDGTYQLEQGFGVTFTLMEDPEGGYVIRDRDGTRHVYGPDCRLLAIVDRNDNRLSFEYEPGTGCLTTILDASARPLSIERGVNGKISTVTDFAGRTVHYAYDDNGNLVSVADPLGAIAQYAYDSLHRLIGIVDPRGNEVLSLTYDGLSRVATIVEGGEIYTISYFERRTEKTDSRGNTWTCFFDDYGFVEKLIDPRGVIHQRHHNLITSTSLDWETFKASCESYSCQQVPYTWTDVGQMGSPGPTADDASVEVPLGFEFTFYGNTYSSARISSNGYITFGTEATAFNNVCIPSPSPPNNYIAPYWDDLIPWEGRIVYATVDEAPRRKLVVQWLDVAHLFGLERETFQLALCEGTNEIIFSYQETSLNGASASIGIENIDGSDGLQICCDEAMLTDGISYSISLPNDGDDGTYRYTYDERGNRTTITDPLGNVSTFAYDTTYNLLEMATDARGIATTYAYDDRGNLLEEHHAVGTPEETVTRYVYDHRGNRIRMIDAEGNTTAFTYDERGNVLSETDPLGHTTAYTYDEIGNQLSVTDHLGNCTTYERDILGRVVRETDALGNAKTRTYDANGNIITLTDANGNVTHHEYDPHDRLVRMTDPSGHTVVWEYDRWGNLVSRTDQIGHVIYYFYDAVDNLTMKVVKIGDALRQIDVDDLVTEYIYDDLDNLIFIVAPTGDTTSYLYDILNRMTSVITPAQDTIFYRYDAADNLLSVTFGANGPALFRDYGLQGRVTRVFDSLGTIRSYAYDRVDRKCSETDAVGSEVRYAYDAAGRLTSIVYPQGQAQHILYDALGRITSVVERDGRSFFFSYDALGRVTSYSDPEGNTTAISYDPNGNVIVLTDPNGNLTRYEYDGCDRLTRETYADGSWRGFAYDGCGNLITLVDPDGDTTNFVYDERNLMTKRDIPGGNDDHYSYNRAGGLETAVNDDASILFGYDKNGRVVREVLNGESVRYEYDHDNRRMQIVYPGGKEITQVYDIRDRLAEIWDQEKIASVCYHDNGKVSQVSYANGISSHHSFDSNNRLSGLRYARDGVDLLRYGYGYSEVGRLKFERALHEPSSSKAYEYDTVDRLLSYSRGYMDDQGGIANPLQKIDYDLDAVGNWLTLAVDGVEEPRTVNEVNEYLAIGGISCQHDGDGNLTDDGTHAYVYDHLNRLIQVISSADSITICSFVYDPLGRRIAKTSSEGTTTYFYDRQFRVIEERKNGRTEATYVYGAGYDRPLMMERDGETFYYLSDLRGSVTMLADGQGEVIEQYRYDPYGIVSILDGYGSSLTRSVVGNPYLYVGRRYDDETAMYYMRARHYNPHLGRFLSRDPLGYREGLNLYEYAGSDPVLNIDPFGLECTDVTVQMDVTEYIEGFVEKILKASGVEFQPSGSFSYTGSKCTKECCSKEGEWVSVTYYSHEFTSSIGITFGGFIPGMSITVGIASMGVYGSLGFQLVGSGAYACEVDERTCEETCTPSGCATFSGSVVLGAGTEAGIEDLGIEAKIEGTGRASGKLCAKDEGLTFKPCLHGTIKLIANIKAIIFSWGKTFVITEGEVCSGPYLLRRW